MSNRIFVPDLKKEYILAEDATILLYPFNYYPFDTLENSSFYAKLAKGKMTVSQKRETLPLIGNEHYYQQYHTDNMRVEDWYMVSDKEFPESVVSLVSNPFDLLKLDPQGTVYLTVAEVVSWTHRHFDVFVPKKDEPRIPYVKPPESKRVVKNIKQDVGYDWSRDGLKKWEEAQALNPLLDKMKSNQIPIQYTIAKGSKFSIMKMNHKASRDNKTLVVTIKVNGKELQILPEDLNQFVLE